MAVLRQNGIPLYYQLKEIFIEKINSGEWKPGEIIPSEVALCEEYGVSRGPVRQALDQLDREGLLARKPGEGTRVRPAKIEQDLRDIYQFNSLIEHSGMISTTESLSFSKINAAGSVARSLDLESNDSVFLYRRLRFGNDEPLVLETIYIPEKIAGEISVEDLESEQIYILYQDRFRTPIIRAIQFFEPVIADGFEAEVLHISPGAPVLLLQNISFTSGDQPVLLIKNIMRGDRVRYFVRLDQPVQVAR